MGMGVKEGPAALAIGTRLAHGGARPGGFVGGLRALLLLGQLAAGVRAAASAGAACRRLLHWFAASYASCSCVFSLQLPAGCVCPFAWLRACCGFDLG